MIRQKDSKVKRDETFRETNTSEILQARLDLGSLGIRTFPLHGILNGSCTCNGKEDCRPGKHPHIVKPFERSTTNEFQLRRWSQEFPHSNSGMPTGRLFGRFALDVDTEKGGPKSIEALEAEYGPLPLTQTVRSGSGGFHYHFLCPKDVTITIPSTAGQVGPGLDVRAERGYVVAPPSLHESGNRYEWIYDPWSTALAEAPDWLLDKVVRKPKLKRSEGLKSVIPEGVRNETLFLEACFYRDHGLGRERAEFLIRMINQTCCSPPLMEEEVTLVLSQAFSYPVRPSRMPMNLAPGTKKVLRWLHHHTKAEDHWIGPLGLIAQGVGISHRQVQRAIADLERRRMIAIEPWERNIRKYLVTGA